MLPELHLVYKNCDTSCEKYYDNKDDKRKDLVLPLIIQNETEDSYSLFRCAKISLIIFAVISICLIIAYVIYTYK